MARLALQPLDRAKAFLGADDEFSGDTSDIIETAASIHCYLLVFYLVALVTLSWGPWRLLDPYTTPLFECMLVYIGVNIALAWIPMGLDRYRSTRLARVFTHAAAVWGFLLLGGVRYEFYLLAVAWIAGWTVLTGPSLSLGLTVITSLVYPFVWLSELGMHSGGFVLRTAAFPVTWIVVRTLWQRRAEARRSTRGLRFLSEISKHLSGGIPEQGQRHRLAQLTAWALRGQVGSVFLTRPGGNGLRREASYCHALKSEIPFAEEFARGQPITGRIFSTLEAGFRQTEEPRRWYVLNDPAEIKGWKATYAPQYEALLPEKSITSYVAAPLVDRNGQVVGVLEVINRRPYVNSEFATPKHGFSAEDGSLLAQIAAHVSSALQAETVTSNLRTLLDVTSEFLLQEHAFDNADQTCRAALKLSRRYAASLAHVFDYNGDLVVIGRAGTVQGLPLRPLKAAEGIAGQVVRTGSVVRVADIQDAGAFANPDFARANCLHGYIAVPLRTARGTEGVLGVYTVDCHIFGADEEAAVTLLAAQLARALGNAETLAKRAALAQVAAAIEWRARRVEEAIDLFLTGCTAKEGLGFNRAAWLRYDEAEGLLRVVGRPVGAQTLEAAQTVWEAVVAGGIGLDAMLEGRATAPEPTASLAAAIGGIVVPWGDLSGALRQELSQEGVAVLRGRAPWARKCRLEDALGAVEESVWLPVRVGKSLVAVVYLDNAFDRKPITRASMAAVRDFGAFAASIAHRFKVSEAERREFLETLPSAVIHEIVQYIGAIICDAYNMRNVATSSASRDLLAECIRQTAEHARDYLRELLEDARVPAIKLLRRDLLELVREVGPEIAAGAMRHAVKIRLRWRERDWAERGVLVDRGALTRVLSQLLQNSAEAVAGNGCLVTVTLGCTAYDELEMVWKDFGPGLPDALLSTLFSHPDSSKHRGPGLGLTQARHIVEKHGGSIEAVPGQGAQFTVRIPFAKPEGAGPEWRKVSAGSNAAPPVRSAG